MSARTRLLSAVSSLTVLLGALGVHPVYAGAAPSLLDNNTSLCSPYAPLECVALNPNQSIINLYWDSNWDADGNVPISFLNDFTQTLVNSSYFASAAQYGVTSMTFAGEYGPASGCASNPGTTTDWGHISDWVLCEKHALNLPPALFVVYAPVMTQYVEPILGLTSCTPYDNGTFAAFHSITAPSLFPLDSAQVFAFIPEQCAAAQAETSIGQLTFVDSTTLNATHEIIEAATDPTAPLFWIDDNAYTGFDIFDPLAGVVHLVAYGEAADLCNAQPGTIVGPPTPFPIFPAITSASSGERFLVEYYWSNADGACVPKPHNFAMTATGLPLPNQAVLDGQPVGLQFATLVADGTYHSAAFLTPIQDSTQTGVYYVTSAAPFKGVITSDVALIANYVMGYGLRVVTNPLILYPRDTSLTQFGVFPPGSVVVLNTDPFIPGFASGDRYRFSGWTGAPVSTVGSTTTVTMDAPHSLTANYVLQHQLQVAEAGLPSGQSWSMTVNGTTSQGPFSGWVDDGAALSLSAQSPVTSSTGTNYFFLGFVPTPPATMTVAFNTVAQYSTLTALITAALNSGAITGPGSQALASSLSTQWSTSESAAARGNTTAALGIIQAFICHVSAQSGKLVTTAFANQLISYARADYQVLGGGSQNRGC